MRARDLFLALLIIGGGLLLTGYHRGAFAHEAWHWGCWDGLGWGRETARPDTANWREADRSSQEVPVQGARALTIRNPSGRTSIFSGTGDTVRMEVVRYARRGSPQDVAFRAQLPRVELGPVDWVFGKDTRQAILGGIVLGARGALRELVEAYATELGHWPIVILTGGDAKLICPDPNASSLVQAIVPELSLRGVAMSFYRMLLDREETGE